MAVAAARSDVNIGLIAHEEFVAAIANACSCGVHLIAVTNVYAVEISANHGCYRVGGTIAHSTIEHLFIVGITQTGGEICSLLGAIGIGKHAGQYRQMGIAQSESVACSKIIDAIDL